jgi:hypothetical protein
VWAGIDSLGMERAHLRISKPIKLSFSFISLLVLLGITTVTAVARAQETIEVPSATTTEDGGLLSSEDPTPEQGETAVVSTPLVPVTNLTETDRVRVRNLAANISNSHDAVLARLTNIADRMQTRSATLEATGFDITVAQAELSAANNALARASSELASIDVLVAGVVASPDAVEAWLRTKAAYEAIDADLRAAHQALLRAVEALRTAAPLLPPTPEATSEPTLSN